MQRDVIFPIQTISFGHDYEAVLKAAKLSAWERSLDRTEVGNLLMAMIDHGDNLGKRVLIPVLADHGQLIEGLRHKLDVMLGSGQSFDEDPDYSLAAYSAFRAAELKAAEWWYECVGCEHLLYGILHIGGPEAEILRSFGLTKGAILGHMRKFVTF